MFASFLLQTTYLKNYAGLVDFLGRKMVDVKVLAVEIKQFKGKNQRAMVPHVIGRTEGDFEGNGGVGVTRPKPTRVQFFEQCPPGSRLF